MYIPKSSKLADAIRKCPRAEAVRRYTENVDSAAVEERLLAAEFSRVHACIKSRSKKGMFNARVGVIQRQLAALTEAFCSLGYHVDTSSTISDDVLNEFEKKPWVFAAPPPGYLSVGMEIWWDKAEERAKEKARAVAQMKDATKKIDQLLAEQRDNRDLTLQRAYDLVDLDLRLRNVATVINGEMGWLCITATGAPSVTDISLRVAAAAIAMPSRELEDYREYPIGTDAPEEEAAENEATLASHPDSHH